MRCSNIGVKFTVPMPVDRPDGNGNIYTKEAIENAIDTYKGLPIIDKTGETDVAVGVVFDATYEESTNITEVYGLLWHGGTDCNVIQSHKDEDGELVIDEFKVSAFGITK